MQAFCVKLWPLLLAACLWSTVQCDPEPRRDFSLPNGAPPPFNPRSRPPQPWVPKPFPVRFRRSPQGSVQGGVTIPEHGRPQLNLDYNHKIIDDGKSTLNGFGGVSSPDLRHFQPHAGVNYEYRPNNDFFVRGQGSVQPLPGGRFDPQIGVGMGWRFRRSPQGSVQGGVTIPEHGHPQLNLDYNQKLIDNGKSTLNAFGGVSTPDMKHFQPHAGLNYEYKPNNDFFVRGQGSVQPLPGGRFDPQIGVGMGWRFR
ncbi:uncharacterized protein LOC107041235 [Diachasma alloeum]|uniref:uncharacterized protein LOC107041235 n=1 Tax=Diachasma alloeum TaxID=454923 RepID=UPI0007383F6A|nr:uncharacterized protein LOC107041235 [Diachasma alloeum]